MRSQAALKAQITLATRLIRRGYANIAAMNEA